MPPKAALKHDPLLRYQYGLARELGMTHKRLIEDLGVGEIAYQLAYDELEGDRRKKLTEQAAKASRQHPRR